MSAAGDDHPAFPGGARVAVVENKGQPGLLGVAMKGGHYVVPLPEGYDDQTKVGWVNGWIFVVHPDFPPMLADTTTGKLNPMCEEAYGTLMANYEYPKQAGRAH